MNEPERIWIEPFNDTPVEIDGIKIPGWNLTTAANWKHNPDAPEYISFNHLETMPVDKLLKLLGRDDFIKKLADDDNLMFEINKLRLKNTADKFKESKVDNKDLGHGISFKG